MSDEVTVPTNTETEIAARPVIVSTSLQEDVASVLASSSKETYDMVKSHLVQLELVSRKDKILLGLTKLKEAKQELSKIKPDSISYDRSGAELSSGWTKAGLERLVNSQKKVDKITQALESALSNSPNFDALNKLLEKSDSAQ